MVLMVNAMAEDKPLAFKVIAITEKPADKNKNIKIVVKDLKNGVLVRAVGGWSSSYAKTAQLIKDAMIARGIKVTDDPTTADVGLQFSALAGFNFPDIEAQANTPDAGKIGVTVAAVLSGGIFGMGGLFNSDTDKPRAALFAVTSAEKPKLSSRGALDGENFTQVFPNIEYQANKTGIEVTNAVFAVLIDDVIKNHFAFDTPTATTSGVANPPPGAQSAVPVAIPVASGVPVAANLSDNQH